jgi:hypothetical protein
MYEVSSNFTPAGTQAAAGQPDPLAWQTLPGAADFIAPAV